jgi:hypothetical protein
LRHLRPFQPHFSFSICRLICRSIGANACLRARIQSPLPHLSPLPPPCARSIHRTVSVVTFLSCLLWLVIVTGTHPPHLIPAASPALTPPAAIKLLQSSIGTRDMLHVAVFAGVTPQRALGRKRPPCMLAPTLRAQAVRRCCSSQTACTSACCKYTHPPPPPTASATCAREHQACV